MRKVLFGTLALLVALAVLSRFAPKVGKRAMEKCREMMGGAAEERGLEEERQQLASSIAR